MLTDLNIQRYKPMGKVYRKPDGKGLFIEVAASGEKFWRYRYEIDGKENMFAIGGYSPVPIAESPEQAIERLKSRQFTLAEARRERDRCRGLVKQGVHPIADQKKKELQQKLESNNTFTAVAEAWFVDLEHGAAWSEVYRRQVTGRLRADVFPAVGDLPIREVKSPHILSILDKVKKRSPVQADKIKTWIGGVFRFAASRLLVEYDPTYPLRGGKLKKVNHYPHLEAKEIGPFLRAVELVNTDMTTMAAFKLLWLTVNRTKNIRLARWEDIDLESEIWNIPSEAMKMGSEHSIPLSRQAIEILQSVKALNKNSLFVFPGRSSWEKPMSTSTFRDVFNRAGYKGKFTPHGIRGTFSTYCNNMEPKDRPDSKTIELCLAHQERNSVRKAYDHAKRLPERKAMMQAWADYLDKIKAGAEIIPIRAAG